MKRAFLILVFAALAASPALAQSVGETPRDSIYFMMDDNEQSPEEMELEAQYVYGLCNANAYQAQYFDCACLAGAFLQQREKLGPYVLQQEIIYDLTKSPSATCANTAVIAGQIYQDCMQFIQDMRELASDNRELCTCAANKTATDFTREPRLNIAYIRRVRRESMQFCYDPANRPRAIAGGGSIVLR